MANAKGAIFTRIRNGYVEILDEKGNYMNHLPNNNWVTAVANGDTICAVDKSGRTEFYDRNGNYKGHR